MTWIKPLAWELRCTCPTREPLSVLPALVLSCSFLLMQALGGIVGSSNWIPANQEGDVECSRHLGSDPSSFSQINIR